MSFKLTGTYRYQMFPALKMIAENYANLSNFTSPIKILDFGCGKGNVTKLLSLLPNVGSIEAIDKDAIEIKYAQQFNDDSRIKYTKRDIDKYDEYLRINGKESSFDIVTVTSFLNMFSSAQRQTICKYSNSALKPGGLFIGYNVIGDSGKEHYNTAKRFYSSDKWKKYFQEYQIPTDFESRKKEYISILKRTNFTKIETTFTEMFCSMNSKECEEFFKENMRPLLNQLPISDSLKKEMLADWSRLHMEANKNSKEEGGEYTINFPFLFFKAYKKTSWF